MEQDVLTPKWNQLRSQVFKLVQPSRASPLPQITNFNKLVVLCFFSSWPGHSFILYAMCNYSIMFQSPLNHSIHLVSSLMSFKALFAAKPPLDTGCMSCSLDRDASSEPRDIFHVHMMFHTLHQGQSVFHIQDGKASSTSLDQHPTALLSLQLSKAQDQATS